MKLWGENWSYLNFQCALFFVKAYIETPNFAMVTFVLSISIWLTL